MRVQSILGSHAHIFSPSLVNDLKVTFFQRRFIDKRYGWDEDLAGAIGLKGVSKTAFPNFAIPGYVALSAPPGRIQTPIRDTQILEALSWFRGSHSLKFGFEYRRAGNNEIRDRGSSGIFQFVPQYTSLPGTPGTGDGLASFLLGEANSANIQISDQIATRAYYLAGYVQDDWRVTNRLTLNLGLRWETELPRRSVDDSQNSFDLGSHQSGIGNSGSGHLLGTERHAAERVPHGLEQLRAAHRLRLPPAVPTGNRNSQRRRYFLRLDCQQYDRRYGLDRIFDLGQPGCTAG